MKLHISSKGRAVSKRLRRFVASRVEQATQRFSNRVNRVDVSVTNSDNVIDQECRVVLSVKGRKDIVATGSSENIMAAIAEAVDRAKRGLTKTLDRSQRRRASPHVF